MTDESSEQKKSLPRRDLLQIITGAGLAGAVGLSAATERARAIPSDYVRYWPIDTDVGSCTNVHGEEYPGTGPGAANWFFWNGCSSYKTYNAVPGEPLILEASTNDAQLLYIDFAIKEPNGNGGWTTVETIDGPDGQHLNVSYTHVPQSDRVRIDAHQGFYLKVYGPPGDGDQDGDQGPSEELQQDIETKRSIIARIRDGADDNFVPQTTLDTQAEQFINNIEQQYTDASSEQQAQFERAVLPLVEAERITEAATTETGEADIAQVIENLADLKMGFIFSSLAVASTVRGGLSAVGELRDSIAVYMASFLEDLSDDAIPEGQLTDDGRRAVHNAQTDVRNSSFLEDNQTELEQIGEQADAGTLEPEDVEGLEQELRAVIAEHIVELEESIYRHYYAIDTGGVLNLDQVCINNGINNQIRQFETVVEDNQLPTDIDRSTLANELRNESNEARGDLQSRIRNAEDSTRFALEGIVEGLNGISAGLAAAGVVFGAGAAASLLVTSFTAGIQVGSARSGDAFLNLVQGRHVNQVEDILDSNLR